MKFIIIGKIYQIFLIWKWKWKIWKRKSQNLLWRRIVLLKVGVYSSNQGVHIPMESVWWGDIKMCRSVCPSVCNANKNVCNYSIIRSRTIMRIPDEKTWRPLQENEEISLSSLLWEYLMKGLAFPTSLGAPLLRTSRSAFFTYTHK